MPTPVEVPQCERWARVRFAIIGPLLAAPPQDGDLQAALTQSVSLDSALCPVASTASEQRVISEPFAVLFPILIRKPPAIFAGSIPPVMSFSGEGKW